MKKNKISKNWVNKQKRDIHVRQSKIEGYRARSVYKLIEIDEKFTLEKITEEADVIKRRQELKDALEPINKKLMRRGYTEEFIQKFLITIRSLIALKKIQNSKIGLIGGISPGFDNMKVDNNLVKKNIGVTIEATSIKEVVDKAKSFEQKIIDDEIKKIKNGLQILIQKIIRDL